MAAPIQDRAFDLAPLLAVSRAESMRELAMQLRVSRRQVQRGAAVGLTMGHADRWANALGYMPGEVWDDWDERSLAIADEIEARRAVSYRRKLDANAVRTRALTR